jgi:hypothetical protein
MNVGDSVRGFRAATIIGAKAETSNARPHRMRPAERSGTMDGHWDQGDNVIARAEQ